MGAKFVLTTLLCALIARHLEVAEGATDERSSLNPSLSLGGSVSVDDAPIKTPSTEEPELANGLPERTEALRDREWPKFSAPVRGAANIFFTETSCITDPLRFAEQEPRLVLNEMSACAVESAARANPRHSVYLLYTCRLYPESVARSTSMVGSLFELANVFVWYPNIGELFGNSPLAALPAQFATAQYPRHDASDALRTILLWKYGGVYLDLDLVVRRSFDGLPRNFLGLNGPGEVNGAILAFAADGVGHRLAWELLEEIRSTYNGLEHYAYNGPAAILRWLKRKCGYLESRFENTESALATTHNLIAQDCQGMLLLPNPVLYPVYVADTGRLYDEHGSDVVMASVRNSTTVHLYASASRLASGQCARKNSRQPVARLRSRHCPVVNHRAPARDRCLDNAGVRVGRSAWFGLMVFWWMRCHIVGLDLEM